MRKFYKHLRDFQAQPLAILVPKNFCMCLRKTPLFPLLLPRYLFILRIKSSPPIILSLRITRGGYISILPQVPIFGELYENFIFLLFPKYEGQEKIP